MSSIYENNEQLGEAIKALLSKYLIENKADYVALVSGDCLYRWDYKRVIFDGFGDEDLEVLVPVLMTSLEKGNCERLGLELSEFEVAISQSKESKIEGKSIGVKVVTPGISEKTAVFEIKKKAESENDKFNGTFLCHKEPFRMANITSMRSADSPDKKCSERNEEEDYYIFSYFKDYFMNEDNKVKEFSFKSSRIKSLALSLKEILDYKKI